MTGLGTVVALQGVILAVALLVLFGVASSKFSARLGLPALVVFIGLGMLAGSEGVAGIAFEDYALANGIGTVALVLILFDGGLRTSADALRLAWRPAAALATVGVALTSVLTGLAAAWILGVSPMVGVLLGCIVGSTDAAAVFSVLRGRGARLPERLGATLEVESGANDPMAVFLTIGLLQVLVAGTSPGIELLGLFALQMSVGAVVGLVIGHLGATANERINLDAAGLYPVLAVTFGVLAFGLASVLGGSGFLAVYLAGIVMGNRRIVFQRGIFLFTDGMAWLAQIVMFAMLGLLSFPSRLLDVAADGLLVAAVLIFVARPIAVTLVLPWFRFGWRETTLVSWVGLRGAVPIILATYPLLAGLPEGRLLFDVVFFVVLVSAVTQGWTLPLVAARLGLQEPAKAEPAVSLEITSLKHIAGDIVDYTVIDGCRATGRLIRELSLPEGAVVAMITRGQAIIPPRGSTRLDAGDHVFVVLNPEIRALVDRVFAPGDRSEIPLPAVEFPLSPRMRVQELTEFYGITVDAAPDCTLERLVRDHLEGREPRVGDAVDLGDVRLTVRDVSAAGIETIGLALGLPDATVSPSGSE